MPIGMPLGANGERNSMNKSIILKFIFIATAYQSTYCLESVDKLKRKIIAILNTSNPAMVEPYTQFCKQYDHLVISFFDTHNNQSLSTHIKQMEQELATLNAVRRDPQFESVKSILHSLNIKLTGMINLLKEYLGSRNAVALALDLQEFDCLLPDAIKNRGKFELFCSLQRRLGCQNH